MRIPILLAVLATAALAAGCSTTGGSATTAPTSTAGSTSASSGNGDTTENGAPKVKTPLDFSKAAAAPCSLLNPTQLQSLGMAGVASKDASRPTGASCGWNDTFGTSGQSLYFTFVVGDGGLDFLYQSKSSYGLFEPQPALQGYPTLLISSNDERKDGGCGFAVGLTDKQHLLVTMSVRGGPNPAPRFNDPCGVAKEAADLALTSIKGGS